MINQRFQKVISKLTWDTISILKARSAPSIEVLHEMRPSGGMQYEFIHRLSSPAYIEPEWGYVVTAQGHLLSQPLSTTGVFGSRPWKFGIPRPSSYFRNIHASSPDVLRFPCVISLRFIWEWNYFHFYSDVLGKLSLLESARVDPNIPIVLGKYANDVHFVRQIINQGRFRERNWIIADEAYILADSIIYSSTRMDDVRKKYDYILSQMQPPGPVARSEDRIFLTRKAAKTRSILNIDAVENALGRHGFRSVDTSGMHIKEQMDLFAQTRYIVSIHGAGLTNIIFRQGCPLSILELHSDVYLSHCFREIADAYQYGWDHLAGMSDVGVAQHANFYISLEQLEEKIAKMLDPTCSSLRT